jgi:hypothetical protein
MLEVVRGFGALLKTGWKPLRTIVFASWDGEEVNLSLSLSPSLSLYQQLALTRYNSMGS